MARKTTPQRGAAARMARGAKTATRKTSRGAATKSATTTRKTAKAKAKVTPKSAAKTAGRKTAAPKKSAIKRGGRMTKTTQTTKKAARRTYARPRKESGDRRGPTRAALYAEIKKRGIPGCSRMSKEELARVLRS